MLADPDYRVQTKICGLTRLEDARFASGALADFLGFIAFLGSPRFIPAEKVKEIINWVHGPKTVAVFVNQPLDDVNEYVSASGVQMIQLHGDESPAYISLLDKPVIKAFGIRQGMTRSDIETMVAPYVGHVAYVLFDTSVNGQSGGTGTSFDWDLLIDIELGVPFFVSGGLDASNVTEVMERVAPFGVDASSRLEVSPGVKDLSKISAFFESIESMYP
jgi:phosphoribosylanthranilate isomerase